MALTELEFRKVVAAAETKVKEGGKVKKVSDGGGLQLWLTPDEGKRWRLAYRFGGKQKVLAIGVYPAVSLKEAREARHVAKRMLKPADPGRAPTDPSEAKKKAKIEQAKSAANTFEAIATELLNKKRSENKAERTIEKLEWLLGMANSALGARPIKEIEAADILALLRPVETRGNFGTAKKLRATVGQVFRYAVATSRVGSDPTRDLKGALASPGARHRAAIVKEKPFGALLRSIADYQGAPETRAAFKLLALTFVRPGELRLAEWREFDLERALWLIPAEKMKMRRDHRVPLAPRAVEVLRALHSITGKGRFLFPSVRSAARSMSENTLNAALRRLGFKHDEMTSHGFRAAAASIMNESGLWNADAIEAQLAHVDGNAVRRAYARADYWNERVKMMAWWADKCDELRSGGSGVPLHARSA
jgi:integrase